MIKVTQEPKHHPAFPMYSFFCHDPNGYLSELQKIDLQNSKDDE